MAAAAQAVVVIAKIRKGKAFAGLGRYLYGPGRNEAHVNPRIVAGESVMLDHTRGWRPRVTDMVWCAERNDRVARPVWHCSPRGSPEDPVLPDSQWAAIAQEHITAMGLAEHPWVAVRHGDDHIHIVACRVNGHRKVWSDRHDYARAMKSVRAIEARHRLTTWTPAPSPGRLATTTIAERERAARRGVDPERAAAGRGLAAWHRELDKRGVKYQAHTHPRQAGDRLPGNRRRLDRRRWRTGVA